jgi:hypothetical protein
MIAYGKRKHGSSKIHPHNECDICSECKISKKRDRQNAKKEIVVEIEHIEIRGGGTRTLLTHGF